MDDNKNSTISPLTSFSLGVLYGIASTVLCAYITFHDEIKECRLQEGKKMNNVPTQIQQIKPK